MNHATANTAIGGSARDCSSREIVVIDQRAAQRLLLVRRGTHAQESMLDTLRAVAARYWRRGDQASGSWAAATADRYAIHLHGTGE